MEYPKISILIPTLNAENVLEDCLKSISIQDYPKELIEIIVADGGSTDNTGIAASKYSAIIIENPLVTAEAGKMAALKVSTGEYTALIDSDNILPDKNWLKQMIEPLLKHPEALGSEPIQYIWRKEDGFITRYCALIGMNDPVTFYFGIDSRAVVDWPVQPAVHNIFRGRFNISVDPFDGSRQSVCAGRQFVSSTVIYCGGF
jgi:glycosyltransferase involved in cell wall biosynthesis